MKMVTPKRRRILSVLVIFALFFLSIISMLFSVIREEANEQLAGRITDDPLMKHSEAVIDSYSKLLRLGIVRPFIVSWTPKVMVLDNFLSGEECDHIVQIAKDNLEPATVVDDDTGKSVFDEWRNSSLYFLLPHEEEDDPVMKRIIQRIVVYTHTPSEYMEPMQVLQYKNGQFYKEHEDYISGASEDVNRSRTMTLLMYLSDVVEGGETWFPSAQGTCSCGGRREKGLSVHPKKGRAVLFWDMTWNGRSDNLSIHAGCEVIKGVKWSATKWLLNGRYADSIDPPGVGEGKVEAKGEGEGENGSDDGEEGERKPRGKEEVEEEGEDGEEEAQEGEQEEGEQEEREEQDAEGGEKETKKKEEEVRESQDEGKGEKESQSGGVMGGNQANVLDEGEKSLGDVVDLEQDLT